MPYTRRRFNRFKRTAGRPTYRRPMYNRYNRYNRNRWPLRRNRWNQNLGTSAMWFKKSGDITAASPQGVLFDLFSPNDVFPIPSFVNVCRNWEQYKVVRVIVKFYPAFVGSETSTIAAAGFRRGNVITWIDQPPLGQQPASGDITILMGFPSAKLHQSRATIKRWMNRPSGGRYANWAFITHPTALGVPTIVPDDWDSQIRMFGDNFSTNATTNKPYYFYEALFKVVFRSRYRGGPP